MKEYLSQSYIFIISLIVNISLLYYIHSSLKKIKNSSKTQDENSILDANFLEKFRKFLIFYSGIPLSIFLVGSTIDFWKNGDALFFTGVIEIIYFTIIIIRMIKSRKR